MSTIRVFLKWCGSVEAVPSDLYEKVMVPRVSDAESRRDETLVTETAETILDHLARFHYGSVEHAVLALLWDTGIRIGAANSLDVQDVDIDEEWIQLEHRSETGTMLKNGRGAPP
jgi:integrase